MTPLTSWLKRSSESEATSPAPKRHQVENRENETAPSNHLEQIKSDLQITSAASSYGELLLSVLDAEDSLLSEIEIFAATQSSAPGFGLSTEPLDDWLKDSNINRTAWSNHCPELTKVWDETVNQVMEHSGGSITKSELAKPSGPARAILGQMLYYPTFSAKYANYAHTLDSTSPCTGSILQKYGFDGRVRTHDSTPIRYTRANRFENPPWETMFTGARDVMDDFDTFNKCLFHDTAFMIVCGRENFDRVTSWSDRTYERVNISLSTKIFGQQPFILVSRNVEDRSIQTLGFFTYHPEYFFRDDKAEIGSFHDLIFNAIGEFTGVPVAREAYFREMTMRPSASLMNRPNQLHLAMDLRKAEKDTGVLMDNELARKTFASTIRHNPELEETLDDQGSILGQVLEHFQAKARVKTAETMASVEWQNSDAARNRLEGLRKATEQSQANAVSKRAGLSSKEIEKRANKVKQVQAHEERKRRLMAGFPPTPAAQIDERDAEAEGEQLSTGCPSVALTPVSTVPPRQPKRIRADREAKKNQAEAQFQALLGTYQVRQLRANPLLRTYAERDANEKINSWAAQGLDSKTVAARTRWIRKRAVFYNKEQWPQGLRYEGDGGPPVTVDPYANSPHPAVSLLVDLKNDDERRARFAVE